MYQITPGGPMPLNPTVDGAPAPMIGPYGQPNGSPYATPNDDGGGLPPQVLAMLRARRGLGPAQRPLPGQPVQPQTNPNGNFFQQLSAMNAVQSQNASYLGGATPAPWTGAPNYWQQPMQPMPLAGSQPVGSGQATLPNGATTQVPAQYPPAQQLPPQVQALRGYGYGGLSQGAPGNPNVTRQLIR